MKRLIALWALLLVPALPLPGEAQALTGPRIGLPAPPFALTTIDGRRVSLDFYKGKTLVINVWATWCPPCRQETADLISSYKVLHKNGVEFLGVDSTEQAPIVRAFVAAKSVPYRQAIDSNKAFAKAYDIRYFPTTYVIDSSGIVRARYIDVMSVAQLAAFVKAAQTGQNGVIASAQQRKIDVLLSPDRFNFSADAATVRATVRAVNNAIDSSKGLVDSSDPAKGLTVDFLRTTAEQAMLRDQAISAFQPVAKTAAERTLLLRMEGDAATDKELWPQAIGSYQSALALSPKDQGALSGLAFAAYELKDYSKQIAADEQLAKLAPSADIYVSLGNGYVARKDYKAAETAMASAISFAQTDVAKRPHDAKAIRRLAWTHLYSGRTYAKAGERAAAHREFAQLMTWTLKLPKNDERYAMYLEEGQEADIALELASGGKTSVSLAPWTGADLPGSVASTIKYRLVVAGNPKRSVTLRATDLSKGWIASFCSDRVCAPLRTAVVIPASGVKIVEFQLIKNDPRASKRTRVNVEASDGNIKVKARAAAVVAAF
ncbi:MAG: redoxin domain-containing protein [Candidatus Eremiobacteraeota bacterium]|nr:redoxin domain-containing protein [Candidatus Eremiobacteraeota bacterium]